MEGLTNGEISLPVISSHVPVAYQTNKYTMLTYNVGDIIKKTYERDLVNLNRDIVFCQEMFKAESNLTDRYHCVYSRPNDEFKDRTDGAILLNRKKFPKNNSNIHRDNTTSIKEEISDRQCTVILEDIILISWHGYYKKIPNDGTKETSFRDLLKYANDLRKKHKSKPVIIGGDFNINPSKAARITEDNPNVFVRFSDIKEGTGSNLDFFLVLTPTSGEETVTVKWTKLEAKIEPKYDSSLPTETLGNLTLEENPKSTTQKSQPGENTSPTPHGGAFTSEIKTPQEEIPKGAKN